MRRTNRTSRNTRRMASRRRKKMTRRIGRKRVRIIMM